MLQGMTDFVPVLSDLGFAFICKRISDSLSRAEDQNAYFGFKTEILITKSKNKFVNTGLGKINISDSIYRKNQ